MIIHGLMMSCVPSLCGKLLSQKVILYPFYDSNDNWFVIAWIHSFIVLTKCSTTGTCSFHPVVLMFMYVSDRNFLSVFFTLNQHL